MTTLIVNKQESGGTLQEYLAVKLGLSKRGAKDLIDKRLVFVNRRCVWMARHCVAAGDTITISAAIETQKAKTETTKEPRTLFENDNYKVIDKPAGSLTPDNAAHRLDRDTSGCLLIAKSPEAREAVISIFKTRRVTKVYEAIVAGQIKEKSSTITTPIEGAEARTHIRVIATNEDASLVRVRIETGRTHQIRIHLASIRHPILGDRVHGLKKSRDPRMMQIPRQMLHAVEIELTDPISPRETVKAHSPLPADFRRTLREFKL